MTQEQRAMLNAVKEATKQARLFMAEAENKIAEAADKCKGTPMEDRLNSIYDELYDLRSSLCKEVQEFQDRLNGEGNEAPESWEEAI